MADNSSKSGRDLLTTLIVVLLLTLVGAGVGFSVGTLLEEGGPASEQSTKATGTGEKDTKDSDRREELTVSQDAAEHEGLPPYLPQDVTLSPLPPILTTLAGPGGRWIRLEGSVILDTASNDKPELLVNRAGEQILTYLRSVRLEQLQSPSGILGLRDDLDETVRTLSDGAVQGVLIHGLVVE